MFVRKKKNSSGSISVQIIQKVNSKSRLIETVVYSRDESKIKELFFKALVLSRILYPGSKLYLNDYLHYFKKENISDESIYRFVDTIYKDEIKQKFNKLFLSIV